MKAAASLLAVLLMSTCTSFGQTAPAPQTVAGGESSKPDAASQPSASSSIASSSSAAATPSANTTAPSAGAVAAVPFTAGAKLFLEPMDGFEQFLAEAFAKKKVPVVVVNERAKADFVLSGDAHVRKPGWLKGMVFTTHGNGNVAINDARTGKAVFACDFRKVNQGETDGQIYQDWASGCARHLRKALEKK